MVEAPVDAGPERLDVGTVNVDRDRQVLAGRLDDVDVVAARDDRLDMARPSLDLSVGLQARAAAVVDEAEARLDLQTAEHADDAPGDMVMDGRSLARAPHERDDREPPARRDVQQMLAVGRRARA